MAELDFTSENGGHGAVKRSRRASPVGELKGGVIDSDSITITTVARFLSITLISGRWYSIFQNG